jgi:hypothetical protein
MSEGKGAMNRAITGFHLDENGDWIADLDCGHTQHVRHRPPWVNRAWVMSEAGRAAHLGTVLNCRICDRPAVDPKHGEAGTS